jgi:iron complex outermembrane receptor protein
MTRSRHRPRRSWIASASCFRGRGTIGWDLNGFSTSASLTHTGSYLDTGTTPNRNVDSYDTIDLTLGYAFGEDSGARWSDGLAINVNASNLFDDDPPFVNSTAGFDPSQASPYGRLITASVTKRW